MSSELQPREERVPITIFECPSCGWAATTGAPGNPCANCASPRSSYPVEVVPVERLQGALPLLFLVRQFISSVIRWDGHRHDQQEALEGIDRAIAALAADTEEAP